MPSYPDKFRDLSAFSNLGLEYSTPSNTAVKMLDALMNQAIYHYSDEQLGGWTGASRKMFEADPEWGKYLPWAWNVLEGIQQNQISLGKS